MEAPFTLVAILNRIFLLNQQTGELWEIDRDKYTAWNCVQKTPARGLYDNPLVPRIQSDRNELVGTDSVMIRGIEYHGQVHPTNCGSPATDPPDPGEPDGECNLEIRQREDLRTYTLVYGPKLMPTRKAAWEEFDQWVEAGLTEGIPTIEASSDGN